MVQIKRKVNVSKKDRTELVDENYKMGVEIHRLSITVNNKNKRIMVLLDRLKISKKRIKELEER